MGNNCVSNLFYLSNNIKINNGTSMESIQGQYLVHRFCSTSEFILHWTVLFLCCFALTFIIGVLYSCYRFDGGEMELQYKLYVKKDEEEEQNDIVV